MKQGKRIRTIAGLIGVVVVAAVTATSSPSVAAAGSPHVTSVRVQPAVAGHIQAASLGSPISTSDCLAMFGIHCYSPLQFRTAYDLNPLYARGITGKGRTIMIVDSFGSPTLQHDLDMKTSSATRPWASLCTALAASADGASTRQKTLP